MIFHSFYSIELLQTALYICVILKFDTPLVDMYVCMYNTKTKSGFRIINTHTHIYIYIYIILKFDTSRIIYIYIYICTRNKSILEIRLISQTSIYLSIFLRKKKTIWKIRLTRSPVRIAYLYVHVHVCVCTRVCVYTRVCVCAWNWYIHVELQYK